MIALVRSRKWRLVKHQHAANVAGPLRGLTILGSAGSGRVISAALYGYPTVEHPCDIWEVQLHDMGARPREVWSGLGWL
jgi:hypothetical protein